MSCSPRAPGSAPRSRSTAAPSARTRPRSSLSLALRWGCDIAINTDAHAPGQLEWLPYGADKAVRCEFGADRIVNTLGADDLLARVASHG